MLRAHPVAPGQGTASRAAKSSATTAHVPPTKVPTVRLSRRQLIQASAVTGAAVAAPGLFGFAPAVRPRGSRPLAIDPPESGFEKTGDWTTHDDELSFLDEVVTDAVNPITMDTIGETAEGRPLHQVVLGLGAAPDGQPRTMPTVMVLGSQHGNEPAGREASLKLLRDLAFADLTDPANADLARLLADQSLIIVPSANPDGRERNSRGNSRGTDINRDHLDLSTEEARAIADVVLEWEPFMALDLHEYGPSAPVVYDDDLLYLWPRNLNVDEAVRTMARTYCEQYIKVDGEAAGYTADEYGLYKVGPNVGPAQTGYNDNRTALQMAGNEDEGICRNAMGLRHTLGILVESRVMMNPAQSPQELVYDGEGGSIYGDSRAARERRVASQRVVLDSMLRFQVEQGVAAKDVCDGSRVRKAREGAEQSAPVYFSGQDDQRPLQSSSTESIDPPTGYQLSEEDRALLGDTSQGIGRAVAGQGISVRGDGFVTMAQHAEPLIPLLLDARGDRSIADAEPVD